MKSEPARSLMQVRVLADPAEAGVPRERLLHDRRRIHERAIAERPDLGLETRGQVCEPAAQHLVVVAAERIAGDVPFAFVGEHLGRGSSIGRGGSHAHADDAKRPRDELARAAAALPVPRHVFHAAVAPLCKPALEIRLVLGQVDACNANLVESEFLRDRIEPRAEPREVAGGEGACHAGTAARGRPV